MKFSTLRFGLISNPSIFFAPEGSGGGSEKPEGEKPEGEGEKPEGEKPEGEGEPPSPEGAAKPNVFERAGSYLKNRGALAAEIAGYKGQVKDLSGQLATAKQTIAAQDSELIQLRAGRDSLEVQLKQLEAEATTVSEGVVDAQAKIGVPQGELPKSAKAEASGADATTPAEKYAHYQTLKGAEKTKYFRAHKADLVEHENTLSRDKK